MSVRTKCQSFTLSEEDIALLAHLKKRCMLLGVETNKSEIVRAGLHLLHGVNDQKIKAALDSVEKLIVGRPPQDKDRE